MPTLRLSAASPTDVQTAADLLRRGRLVAFPTETVYGLGASIEHSEALARIFEAKGRPLDDPLILHGASEDDLRPLAAEWPEEARALAASFWPGPLTLILRRSRLVPDIVTAGRDTVALRNPSHPTARMLLRATGAPVAAPSANRFMHTSPTTADHVLSDLEGRIDAVLDGGPTPIGIESTVIRLGGGPPALLRPGAVTRGQLEGVLGPVEIPAGPASGPQLAPGMYPRHYAPTATLLLWPPGDAGLAALREEAARLLEHGVRVGVLASREEADLWNGTRVHLQELGARHDPVSSAQALYRGLRALDEAGAQVILAQLLPDSGIGAAVNDRLRRAACGGETWIEGTGLCSIR